MNKYEKFLIEHFHMSQIRIKLRNLYFILIESNVLPGKTLNKICNSLTNGITL